jgi:hypothetical protein
MNLLQPQFLHKIYKPHTIEKEKYSLTRSLKHCLIIYHHPTKDNEYYFYNLPITQRTINNSPSKIVKILYQNLLIEKEMVLKKYEKWVQEESQIIIEYRDHNMRNREYITVPVRRRGNEHYHTYTWSRLQWYNLVFSALPLNFNKTTNKKQKNKKNRTIYKANTLMITLTYPEKYGTLNSIKNCSKHYNSWITNIKAKLKRRNNELLFYFKALECQGNGMIHFHIIAKLQKPIDLYAIPTGKGTYYRPFNKQLFNWQHGFYDIRAVQENKQISYLMKYITKTTNKTRSRKETQTLALTWINNLRLYSNSMFDLFKVKFPSTHQFLKSLDMPNPEKLPCKCTVNRLVDEYWNGLTFPKINWTKQLKEKFRLKTRIQADRTAQEVLKYPIESRLNYEGFYELTALRYKKPDNSVEVRPFHNSAPRKRYSKEYIRQRLKRKLLVKKFNTLNKLNVNQSTPQIPNHGKD